MKFTLAAVAALSLSTKSLAVSVEPLDAGAPMGNVSVTASMSNLDVTNTDNVYPGEQIDRKYLQTVTYSVSATTSVPVEIHSVEVFGIGKGTTKSIFKKEYGKGDVVRNLKVDRAIPVMCFLNSSNYSDQSVSIRARMTLRTRNGQHVTILTPAVDGEQNINFEKLHLLKRSNSDGGRCSG